MFDKAKTCKQRGLRQLALDTLLRLPVTAMTRKERETLLDKITTSFQPGADQNTFEESESAAANGLISANDNITSFRKELSLLIRSMEQPNPTSELVRTYIVRPLPSLTVHSVSMPLKYGISPVFSIDNRLIVMY
jgi:hypothetical protein